jgi:di/tricarboxylate transporter
MSNSVSAVPGSEAAPGPNDLLPTGSVAATTQQNITVPEVAGVAYFSEQLPAAIGEATIAPDDHVRRRLAFWLLALLFLIIIAGFIVLAFSKPLGVVADDLKGLVQLFFTSVLTLVSTVLGFYFGAEKSRRRDKDG